MPLQLLDSANRKTLFPDRRDHKWRQTVHAAVRCAPVCPSRNSRGNHRGTICSTCASLPSRTPGHAAFKTPRHSTASPEPRSRLGDTSALEIIKCALRFRRAALFGSVADILPGVGGEWIPNWERPGSSLQAGGHICLVQNRQQRFKFSRTGIEKIRWVLHEGEEC